MHLFFTWLIRFSKPHFKILHENSPSETLRLAMLTIKGLFRKAQKYLQKPFISSFNFVLQLSLASPFNDNKKNKIWIINNKVATPKWKGGILINSVHEDIWMNNDERTSTWETNLKYVVSLCFTPKVTWKQALMSTGPH